METLQQIVGLRVVRGPDWVWSNQVRPFIKFVDCYGKLILRFVAFRMKGKVMLEQ